MSTQREPAGLGSREIYDAQAASHRVPGRRLFVIVALSLCVLVAAGVAWWSVESLRREREVRHLNEEFARLTPDLPVFPFQPDLGYGPILQDLAVSRSTGRTVASKQFERSLWPVHEEIITYVGNRLQLSAEAQEAALRRARERNAAMADVYYEEFRKLVETETEVPETAAEFSWAVSGAARDFSRVLSARVCDFASVAFGAARETPRTGALALLSVPCSLILKNVLVPLTARMEEEGLLLDYINSKVAIQNHLQKAVLELATAEATFEEQLDWNYSREVFFELFTSTGSLQVAANPTVKAGFNLLDYFSYEVDSASRELVVTLPQPEILSIEPNMKINEIDPGLLVSIDEPKINAAMREIRSRARIQAIDSGLLERAKDNARVVVQQLLAPIARTPLGVYGIRIEFLSPLTLDDIESRL